MKKDNISADTSNLDTIKAAQCWSKVSIKRKNYGHLFVFCSLCLVLLVYLSIPDNRKNIAIENLEIKSDQLHINTDYYASLNENLSYLQSSKTKKISETIEKKTISEDSDLFETVASDSKAILARQHAPTTMYNDPSSAIRSNMAISSNHKSKSINVYSLAHPAFTLASGEFLQVVLETNINSDFPGKIRAVLSKPAYAYTGKRELIPAGSRLVGHYASAVFQGQTRVMVIWDRIALPSGIIVTLDSPNTDQLGQAGQGADSIDRHWLTQFSTSALLSVIGSGGIGQHDNYQAATQYYDSIAQSFQQASRQSLQGAKAIKPTLHIHQGTVMNVFVAQDLNFYPVLKNLVVENT